MESKKKERPFHEEMKAFHVAMSLKKLLVKVHMVKTTGHALS